uniref:Integrase catalytic domain-containing protein n=1 Tax=Schizaphis graminum TaxID=13262 RepID=A0A2S2NNC8_SCHGA
MTANTSEVDESRRVIRMLERSTIKREVAVNRLRSVMSLAERSMKDPEESPHLLEAVEDLDNLWSKFEVEDEAILDHLLSLERSSEYSSKLSAEMRELVTFCRSVARRYRESEQSSSNMSVHSGSHVSVMSNKDATIPAVQQTTVPDITLPTVSSSQVSISRLPEIPLPSFDGDIFQWPSFRDKFSIMVDQRPTLSNIDKLHYLLGCLRGSAMDAIRSIPPSGHTYKLIWSSLESRFDKPRLVAGSVVESLLSTPPSTTESLAELNRFMVAFSESVSVLESLAIPNLGDFILFSLASRCLPTSCRTLFETQVTADYPTVHELFAFVKSRVSILERVQDIHVSKPVPPSRSLAQPRYDKKGHRRSEKPPQSSFINAAPLPSRSHCICCNNGKHALPSCNRFKKWSNDVRSKWARDHKLCFRCLEDGHWSPQCKSSTVCSHCSRKHHTLVHTAEVAGTSRKEETIPVADQPGSSSVSTSCVGQLDSHSVLLGTALVQIRDHVGTLHTVRALVDSASQISAITSSCSSRLGLRVSRWTAPVIGLSGAPVPDTLGIVNCNVQPRYAEEPVLPIKAWVFSTITANMPRQPLSKVVSEKYRHLALADPSFTTPSAIDLLLGADIFAQVLNGKRVSFGETFPVAFGSVFGWIIIGPVPNSTSQSPHSCPISLLNVSVESLLDKFWSIEEPAAAPEIFTEEGQCESLFRMGCTRSSSGRFTVPLPFRQPVTDELFRGSRTVAIKRFEYLERRLSADHRLRDLYIKFMSEYCSLGHMSPTSNPGSYYIPHHAVYQPSETDPKIRVVFDASARAFNGVSLNNCLLPGPKLQRDVVDVLLLFRLLQYVFTTDICKMYRQILIVPEHRKFQRILWRASPYDQLQEYQLNTVTYGVNCAPYLAIRVLQHIADSDCTEFPSVRKALLFHTYVDDICVGADSEEAAVELQSALIAVLGRAGLELKKWSSNTHSILNNVPPEDQANGTLPFDEGDGIKVLGLRWSPHDDAFTYGFQNEKLVATKRGMLSLIARIFDPLGLLSPVVFMAKHFMKLVWRANVAWDEPLPPSVSDVWHQFVTELPELRKLCIPRFVHTRSGMRVVLCGFCDASERGYAAVVYIRSENSSGSSVVSLLGSKTKLAPMAASTIPRLELCGAVLLAKWMSRIKQTLSVELEIVETHAWSDSTIVLNWLAVRHVTFKVFVSNRIHQVQSLLPDCQWHHISSEDNPADCASRGLTPSELVNHVLFWKGPTFLTSSTVEWATRVPSIEPDQLPEAKVESPTVLLVETTTEWYSRFSSYVHMIRVVAYVRRFILLCRRRQQVFECYLTRGELDSASLAIVRFSQLTFFSKLCHELSCSRSISVRSVARLRPYIDDSGVIRVGGRLSNAQLSHEQRHPVLLAKSSHLSLLLIRHWHDLTGHSGPRVITALLGRQYWIMSVGTLIRTVISHCTRCVRLSAANPQPVMADLPRSRVTECRPFSRVGIDYAGPLLMKEHRLRKARQYKVYVAVFVCFAVKAVHLEVVSDLSTDAFIAALNRFVARRGLPTDIYSDCGTNFVGAAAQLKNLINHRDNQGQLSASIQSVWHFNPPGAPHFGGLWEAAVRSAKTLLVRIMGEHTFTLEEFNTILCRVEAILNSRPLTPSSTDPNEIDYLSPGHFLIGQPLLAPPEEDILPNQYSLNNRWKLLNQCAQAFWRRWRDEYLQTLQTRGRWTTDTPNLTVDDLVIVKDPHTPPLTWRMARILDTVPGTDGVVRVVRLRTSTGVLTRPVVKVVKLPIA